MVLRDAEGAYAKRRLRQEAVHRYLVVNKDLFIGSVTFSVFLKLETSPRVKCLSLLLSRRVLEAHVVKSCILQQNQGYEACAMRPVRPQPRQPVTCDLQYMPL